MEGELRPRFKAPIYVDGSFVTDVDSPNDVDVVVDVTQAPPEEQQQGVKFWHWHKRRLMARYRVDLWLNTLSDEDDMIVYFQGLRAQTARFADLRENHRKGILRIA